MVPFEKLFYLRLKLCPPPPLNLYCRYINKLTLDQIKASIPKRIERGPTDILKALAQTFKRDPTAYDYKFMDDPYFYPLTQNSKRNHSLSMESGRKAAQWIVKEYPQLFDHKFSEPFIKALAPQIEYNENSDVTEQTLLGIIAERNVSDAIYVYSLLKKKDIEVSNDTKQTLLELVCFYNCEKLFDETEYETNWFKNLSVSSSIKTWKDNGFAEELFNEMKPDCSLAYSTLIQGMLKYGQIEEAMVLLNKGREKNLKFSIGVYNGLIECSPASFHNPEQIWNHIIELLKEMKQNDLKPDLYTLNAILKIMNEKNLFDRKHFARKVLNEFANIGITPSLGTHHHMLQIMCGRKREASREENGKSTAYLKETLQKIPMRKLDVRHPDDTNFFKYAMFLCENFGDLESAQILISLVRENNENLFGGAINESAFYRSYFNLIFKAEPVEHVMEIYKELVPTICNLEDPAYQKLLTVIEKNEAFEHLPLIWNDLTTFFGSNKRFSFAARVLSLSKNWNGKGEDVCKVFREVADLCLKELNADDSFRNISEDMISNLIITLLKLDNFDNALALFKSSSEKRFSYLGFDAIECFHEYCLQKEEKDHILTCLKVADKLDYPKIIDMAKKTMECLGEDHNDYEWVKNLREKREAEAKKKEKRQKNIECSEEKTEET